jgi:CRP/FNR family transcriptional regulator, anaerobic regulatory protein
MQNSRFLLISNMKKNSTIEYNSSPRVAKRLAEFGTTKNFEEGEAILNENAYIKAIPIVTKGSIRVMRTDEDGREILLYYIKAVLCHFSEACTMIPVK